MFTALAFIAQTTFAFFAPPPVPAPDQWWQQVTELKNGQLILSGNSWWKRATALAPGGHFTIDLDHDGDPDLLIRREGDMLVMIVDDDDDMPKNATEGDKDSDCYVVDRDRDGAVDRMVDYIDNNRDQVADEMDIRYFDKGSLRYAWFWEDLDHDGLMWDLKNYEYSTDPYKCDMIGDNLFYLNKYDTQKNAWIPFSECPFAFYDLDHDGRAEAVVRVSASPIGSDSQHDYANNYKFMWAPMEDGMRNIGNVNVRLSYALTNSDTDKRPYAYDFGFTMSGATPYSYAGMEYTNPLRRAPQMVKRIPFGGALDMAKTYHAAKTGFSWDEYDVNDRWEGIFWLWERRMIPNTGGPNAKWNIRREYDANPSSQRLLYYSEVDQRIHLRGAQEGWIEVGHIGDERKLGEIRMSDSDGDGYFDTWSYDLNNDGVAEEVFTVRDQRARAVELDYEQLRALYAGQVLPKAIQANQAWIAALKQIAGADAEADRLIQLASEDASDERKRLLLDFGRQRYYHAAVQQLNAAVQKHSDASLPNDRAHQEEFRTKSEAWWTLSRTLDQFKLAYAEGRTEEGLSALKTLQGQLGTTH